MLPGLGQHHAALDFVLLGAAQQHADVVAGVRRIQQLAEHLDVRRHGLAGLPQPDDFHVVHALEQPALHTAGHHGAAAFNVEHVLDAHQKRLVHFPRRQRDKRVNGLHQRLDGLLAFRISRQRLLGTAADHRGLVARKFILVQQVPDFHFHQLQQFRIVHQVNLVQDRPRWPAPRPGGPAARAPWSAASGLPRHPPPGSRRPSGPRR